MSTAWIEEVWELSERTVSYGDHTDVTRGWASRRITSTGGEICPEAILCYCLISRTDEYQAIHTWYVRYHRTN